MVACANGAPNKQPNIDRAEKYEYVSYSYSSSNVERITFDVSGGVLAYPGTYNEMTVCPESDPNICIKSDRLSFCIPKLRHNLKTWICSGDAYSHVESIEISILGLVTKVDVFRSGDVLFYFSDKDGLLAIKFLGKSPLSEFYVSAASRGFGASK